mgnify:CR=1 FL=1
MKLAGKHVLVLEDEPIIAFALEDMLIDEGSTVVVASSLSDAMQTLSHEEYDFAILDVNLKGESVWPVAERLREQRIPFVLATGGHVDPPPAHRLVRPQHPLTHEPGALGHRQALFGYSGRLPTSVKEGDVILIDGRSYVPFAPFPAVAFMPLVAVIGAAGADAAEPIINAVLAGGEHPLRPQRENAGRSLLGSVCCSKAPLAGNRPRLLLRLP